VSGRTRERGVASIYFVVLVGLVIFGMMVFAVDYGRLYLIQGELQTAADAAALAAAQRLVGIASSDADAANQVTAVFDNTSNNDNRFNLRLNSLLPGASDLVTTQTVEYFSTREEALTPGAAGGATGAAAKYVRVQITAQAPVMFPQFLSTDFSPQAPPTVIAQAVAGISSPICTACGIDVLAVVDQSAGADTLDFGLTQGDFYTLYLNTTQQSAPTGPTNCTTTTPADITGIGNAVVPYVILDHIPTGVPAGTLPDDGDSALFELAAAGMESSDSDTIGGSAVVGGPAGNTALEAPFGTSGSSVTTGWVPTTEDPGQDVICGLNTRFGVDPTTAPPCNTLDGGLLSSLAQAYTAVADTDQGNFGPYTNATDANQFLEDFSTEYNGNLHRVLTLPVVDAADTLNVLGFRQFLLETDPAAVNAGADAGLNPAAATPAANCQAGAFPVQYLGWPVPLRCGGVGGACTVSYGVGRTVLH